jgi:hypothetical protein
MKRFIQFFFIFMLSFPLFGEQEKRDELFEKLWATKNLDFVEIELKDGPVRIPQSKMLEIMDRTYTSFNQELGSECKCDTSGMSDEYKTKRAKLVFQLKQKLQDSKLFLQDLFWNEVEAFRRYGVTYVLINLSLEIIEHQISPIPLCKIVMFASRFMATTLENAAIHLMPFLIGKSYAQSFATFRLKWNYYWIKRQVRKKWLKKESSGSGFKELFQIGEAIDHWRSWKMGGIALTNVSDLTAIEKMIWRDQIVEDLELQLEMYRSYAQFAYSDKKLMKRSDYLKTRFNIGKMGKRIDLLKRNLTIHLSSEVLKLGELEIGRNYDEIHDEILKGIKMIDEKTLKSCSLLMEEFFI